MANIGSASLLDNEQLANAAIIYQVGKQLGASPRDIQIALITALAESGLRNLNYGNADSLGLFQQRPSMDWGTAAQIVNPVYAARAFFLGSGSNIGLLKINHRDNIAMGALAQAVQKSANPGAYNQQLNLVKQMWPTVQAKAGDQPLSMDGGQYSLDPVQAAQADQQTFAPGVKPGSTTPGDKSWMADYLLGQYQNPLLAAPSMNTRGQKSNPDLELFTTPIGPHTNADPSIGLSGFAPGVNSWRKAVVQAAKQYVGVPYVWGGENPNTGFDCSGLVQYVFNKIGINLPRVSYDQASSGKIVPLDRLKPGDLVAWDNNPSQPGADHIAIYAGNGRVIEAPKPGYDVRIRPLGTNEGAYGVRMSGG